MMDGNVVDMSGQDTMGHTQSTSPEENEPGISDVKKSFQEILVEERGHGEIPYQLRPLKDKDLFPMMNILKKIGIKDLKNAFVQEISDGKSIKDIGIVTALDLADILLGNLQNIEDEVYALWSDISGIPVDDIKEMEFGTLPLMIADTFVQAGNSSFFRVLSRLLS